MTGGGDGQMRYATLELQKWKRKTAFSSFLVIFFGKVGVTGDDIANLLSYTMQHLGIDSNLNFFFFKWLRFLESIWEWRIG